MSLRFILDDAVAVSGLVAYSSATDSFDPGMIVRSISADGTFLPGWAGDFAAGTGTFCGAADPVAKVVASSTRRLSDLPNAPKLGGAFVAATCLFRVSSLSTAA